MTALDCASRPQGDDLPLWPPKPMDRERSAESSRTENELNERLTFYYFIFVIIFFFLFGFHFFTSWSYFDDFRRPFDLVEPRQEEQPCSMLEIRRSQAPTLRPAKFDARTVQLSTVQTRGPTEDLCWVGT